MKKIELIKIIREELDLYNIINTVQSHLMDANDKIMDADDKIMDV